MCLCTALTSCKALANQKGEVHTSNKIMIGKAEFQSPACNSQTAAACLAYLYKVLELN